jgi:hypothetical protein
LSLSKKDDKYIAVSLSVGTLIALLQATETEEDRMQKAIYNGNQYEVISTEGEMSKICPRGGGFQGTIKTSLLEIVEEWESNIVDGFAGIDGGVMYPCKCDPNARWNGWACPTFSRDVMKKILKECILNGDANTKLGHDKAETE